MKLKKNKKFGQTSLNQSGVFSCLHRSRAVSFSFLSTLCFKLIYERKIEGDEKMEFDYTMIGEPVHPGEYELKWALREQGYKVKDVSMDPQYWHEDVDLIATNMITNNVTKIEVKWDKRLAETGNFFIEINNPKGECGKGWFKICQADILAYGDAVNKIFYLIEFPQLKEYINENESKLEMRRTWDGSEGYVLPISEVAAFTTTFEL